MSNVFFCRSDMVVMPHAGVQDLAGVFRPSCTEPLMKTMSPSPAFLFAGPRSLSISLNFFYSLIVDCNAVVCDSLVGLAS